MNIGFGSSGNTNWWDPIGLGHDDDYSHALAYRACILLGQLTKIVNMPEETASYYKFSANLKANCYNRFYNSETGVLAGWESEDGVLHDYYFTFVNGVAITYGLIEEREA